MHKPPRPIYVDDDEYDLITRALHALRFDAGRQGDEDEAMAAEVLERRFIKSRSAPVVTA